MYCGDETAAIIGDVGTIYSKFGFAGEDHPKCVIPSVVGLSGGDEPSHAGMEALLHRGASLPLGAPCAEGSGRLTNWDHVMRLWEHAVEHVLSSKVAEHPLLVCCNTAEPDAARAKYAELAFERLGPPALFLARNAMLSAFASGRPTALVVDFGGGSTSVSPVVDGYVLRK